LAPEEENASTMHTPPLAPYAAALRAFFEGDKYAALLLRSSLGERDEIPAAVFFRTEDMFFPFEEVALNLCRGRILDAGAGTGVHSLALQQRGLDPVSIDILPEAVEIMRERGIASAELADMFELEAEPFDTVLMLMNGIGPVQTLEGLDRFLKRAPSLLTPGGQILVDSAEARTQGDPPDPAIVDWPALNLAYPGESWIQLEYKGIRGDLFRELYVDERTLRERAEKAGWRFDMVYWEGGTFVARLTRP
jgi:SAM-dependent methyltransferase